MKLFRQGHPFNRCLDELTASSDNSSILCLLLQLLSFQKAFNGVDIDLRSSPEAKAELMLRCDELQDALWDMCDQRMNDNEAQLRTLRYVSIQHPTLIFGLNCRRKMHSAVLCNLVHQDHDYCTAKSHAARQIHA